MVPRTEPWYNTHHGAGKRRKIRLARAVRFARYRIETSRCRRITRSTVSKAADRSSKKGQTNLLRRLQEECPSRPSAQRSPLSGELDTPTGILVADRLSWDGQGAGKQRVVQVASKVLIDWRLDDRIAHPKVDDQPFSG